MGKVEGVTADIYAILVGKMRFIGYIIRLYPGDFEGPFRQFPPFVAIKPVHNPARLLQDSIFEIDGRLSSYKDLTYFHDLKIGSNNAPIYYMTHIKI